MSLKVDHHFKETWKAVGLILSYEVKGAIGKKHYKICGCQVGKNIRKLKNLLLPKDIVRSSSIGWYFDLRALVFLR